MTEHDEDEDWARELWPDDEYWPDPPVHIEGTSGPRRAAHSRRMRLRLITIGVVAACAGVAGALIVTDISAGPASPASANSGRAARPEGGQQQVPGGQQQQVPGGQQQAVATIVVGGRVTAVSPRSITIDAGPQSVTAAVTRSSRFTGAVTSIAAVRIGDQVLAQISQSNGVSSLVSLQDPVSLS